MQLCSYIFPKQPQVDGICFICEGINEGDHMKEYKIIESTDFGVKHGVKEVEKQVNKALREGWDLAGGVSISGAYVYQAIVREIKESSDE